MDRHVAPHTRRNGTQASGGRHRVVRVEPLRLEWIEALIDGDAVFAERFGIAVLVHCGFTRTATIADPDQGVDEDVWRWELPLG